jgi:hypothetical protein
VARETFSHPAAALSRNPNHTGPSSEDLEFTVDSYLVFPGGFLSTIVPEDGQGTLALFARGGNSR